MCRGTGSGSGDVGPLVTSNRAISMIGVRCPNCCRTCLRGQCKMAVNWGRGVRSRGGGRLGRGLGHSWSG